MNNYIAVTSNNHSPPSGVIVTLESAGIFFTILLAITGITASVFAVVSKFYNLSNSVKKLQEDFDEHSLAKGHEKLIEEVEILETFAQLLDKKLDLHIQDYLHNRDMSLMAFNQIGEKLEHKSKRFSDEIKDLQKFLQASNNYQIRNYCNRQGDEK